MLKKIERQQWLDSFCGLNREIANVVELQHYVKIEDVVHVAMKVERQLKRGERSSSMHEAAGSSNWKSKWSPTSKQEEKPTSRPKEEKIVAKQSEKGTSNQTKEIMILNASDVKALVIFLINAQTGEP